MEWLNLPMHSKKRKKRVACGKSKTQNIKTSERLKKMIYESTPAKNGLHFYYTQGCISGNMQQTSFKETDRNESSI